MSFNQLYAETHCDKPNCSVGGDKCVKMRNSGSLEAAEANVTDRLLSEFHS